MVILPSGNDINGLLNLIEVLADPKKAKQAIASLQEAAAVYKQQEDSAIKRIADADARHKEVQSVIDGLADREKAVAAREEVLTGREAKIISDETALKMAQDDFKALSTKELPARMAEVKKREDAVAKAEAKLVKGEADLEQKLIKVNATQKELDAKLENIRKAAA